MRDLFVWDLFANSMIVLLSNRYNWMHWALSNDSKGSYKSLNMRCLLKYRISSSSMNSDSSISLPRTLENGFASGLTYLQFCVRLNERATLLCYTQIASSRNRKHCESLSQNFANVVFMVHNFLRIVVIFCLRMRKRLCYEALVFFHFVWNTSRRHEMRPRMVNRILQDIQVFVPFFRIGSSSLVVQLNKVIVK